LGVIAATNGAVPGVWLNQYHLVAQNLTADFTDADHATVTHTAEDPPRTEAVGEDNDPWREAAADFIAAVMENRPARAPIREGALTLELALAAASAAEQRAEVLISPKA